MKKNISVFLIQKLQKLNLQQSASKAPICASNSETTKLNNPNPKNKASQMFQFAYSISKSQIQNTQLQYWIKPWNQRKPQCFDYFGAIAVNSDSQYVASSQKESNKIFKFPFGRFEEITTTLQVHKNNVVCFVFKEVQQYGILVGLSENRIKIINKIDGNNFFKLIKMMIYWFLEGIFSEQNQ